MLLIIRTVALYRIFTMCFIPTSPMPLKNVLCKADQFRGEKLKLYLWYGFRSIHSEVVPFLFEDEREEMNADFRLITFTSVHLSCLGDVKFLFTRIGLMDSELSE